MASLHDVMAYLAKNYPHPHELSDARLTKMVYLADWRSAILRGRQVTNLRWYFDHFGPYVHDVIDLAKKDDDFSVSDTINAYGDKKKLVTVKSVAGTQSLSSEEIAILDFVIQHTAPRYWKDFIKLVYSTHPIMSQPKYSMLDLVGLAKDYQDDRAQYIAT